MTVGAASTCGCVVPGTTWRPHPPGPIAPVAIAVLPRCGEIRFHPPVLVQQAGGVEPPTETPETDAARRRRRPPTHPHVRLRRDAVSRYGVTSRGVAAGLGIAPSTYDDWRVVEDARRLHRGVVALPDVEVVAEQRVAAALLAVGVGAVAGGATAAFLHDLERSLPRVLTVLVPHGRRATSLDEVEVIRTRHLRACDRTVARRLDCVTVERLVLDLVAERGAGEAGLALVLAALQREVTTLDALRQAARAAGSRRGGALQRVLHHVGDHSPDSIFEHLVEVRLRRSGLDPVVGFAVVLDGRRIVIDLAFPQERVAVECDGFAFHRTPGDLARDHERQNALVRAGWRVYRISWRRWSRAPDAVIADVVALLTG